jgi:aconitate hydratase
MNSLPNPFQTLKTFGSQNGKPRYYYSLPALEAAGFSKISRMPISIRIVLESVLRNCDGLKIQEKDVRQLAEWNASKPAEEEIPFVVSRIVLQDFTGVPLLVDLAAMRDAVKEKGSNPAIIEPLVPVDLVIDHSVQVDRSGSPDAFLANLQIEFERNRERYEFLKWGQQAFETFSVVPPSIGIVHQVNLEHLAKAVFHRNINGHDVFYPDSLVGTDSHTTMINGLGIVGWGVGGIEAEAGMLGQPVYFLTPEVIGVHITGSLRDGVTATDLALRVTELLRKEKVVGKFVEFFGEGARNLTVADRATIANMAPEYGATMGFFGTDEKSIDYLRSTGRSEEHIQMVREYYEAQQMFGIPLKGEVDYTKVVELNLSDVVPSVAGPKRPQDRINVPDLKSVFHSLFEAPVAEGGYGKKAEEYSNKVALKNFHGAGGGDDPKLADQQLEIGHGAVLIAAITSCTNTSNPSVMIAAGLVAEKAVALGLTVPPYVKTSLAPGSRVVTDYLEATGLQKSLDKIGFELVGYGCTTCIGNSGPLADSIENAIREGDLVAASVLSGNRNFEARVHGSIRANFLMSPPLVVAYALAGRIDIDFDREPIGHGKDGKPVFFRDIWPSHEEILHHVRTGIRPEMFSSKYSGVFENPEWDSIKVEGGTLYQWNQKSTYIQKPPFFDGFSLTPSGEHNFQDMRPLAILGDSVTTDHISPAGSFKAETPAGKYLIEQGVPVSEFNSYGSRRGNDRIMTRGTFANVRVKNKMADGKEGGFTKLMPEGKLTTIYEASREYISKNVPLIVFAGVDYGMGSSRDWAAKGTNLLGVKAVVAKSFERIHRSNLVGMGVLPLQFPEGVDAQTLGLDGSETYTLEGLEGKPSPKQNVTMKIRSADGSEKSVNLILRIDTAIEVEYYMHGGILPYVLRELIAQSASA